MIHEYAIEPSVLSSWAMNKRDYAEFLREYGLGTPRIFSSFPKTKTSKLRSYLLRYGPADDQSLHSKRYLEMVTKLLESIVLREIPDYPPHDWTEIVTAENERAPFGVILSSDSINTKRSITSANMYEPDSVWNHPVQLNIQRTNEGVMDAISESIRLATMRIVIVDTFGWTPEAIFFIQFLINSIPKNRVNKAVPSIALFYKEKRGGVKAGGGSPSADHVKNEIEQGIKDPADNMRLTVTELRETPGSDVFHNRCILSELGGVITGHGIGVSGNDRHTDEAILMAPVIYQKKWRQFVEQLDYEIVSQAN